MNEPTAATVPATPTLSHYKTMALIREVETRLLESFGAGLLRGTTHTYLGQESIAVSALSFLGPDDIVVSNHRSHGHFIAYGGDFRVLLDEIMGAPEGVCGGLGGSQHLQHRNFYSNGVLGGTAPVAAGMALAERVKASGSVAVCFIGDGALGEGVVYETLNMAALWNVPILFVVEANGYAQSTPTEKNLSGSIIARFKAFGVESAELESNDIADLLPAFERAFSRVRQGRPYCQVIRTYRMGPHSKGDDTRDPAEREVWRKKDPLLLAEKHVGAEAAAAARQAIESEVRQAFEDAAKRAAAAGAGTLPSTDHDLIPASVSAGAAWAPAGAALMVNHLNAALQRVMEDDVRTHVIGEDILDPYGGAFKVTKGLSTRFPDRTHSSPISEAGIVGLANGMALRGLRPIVEIMFGDFSTLILDQLLNHAAKFERMYAEKVRCPVIVRAPMGGYRGYGPTHSQSLDKLFLGIPGLVVAACDPLRDQRVVWERLLGLDCPCVYIENKGLYGQALKPYRDGLIDGFHAKALESHLPTAMLQLTPFDRQPDAVLLTYGGMTPLAMAAARRLFIEEESSVRVVVPVQLAPLPENDLLEAVGSCRRVMTLEEGTRRAGWGAEVGAFLAERLGRLSFSRCAAADTIIPTSREGEAAVLPAEQRLYEQLRRTLDAL